MTYPRRSFLQAFFAAGAVQGLISSQASARAISSILDTGRLDADTAQSINPDFDRKAYNYWSGFMDSDVDPVVITGGQTRGGGGGDALQPVFLHYGKTDGFQDATQLDASKLVEQGDVMVSVNTSTIKVGSKDQETFEKLQNAQIRVDVAQRTSILPIIEAMAYTVVGGMRGVEDQALAKTSANATKRAYIVQSIDVDSDSAWQKMQNVPLPKGEGRWALNLEAQRKDSLFCQVLSNVVRIGGQFAPVLGLPGIAMSALNSFNTLYGALHSRPVSIIQASPTRVFATQEALANTGSPGAVRGIVLQSGTYVLMAANQVPSAGDLKNLTVMQGRVVPPKTTAGDLDEAAGDTLKDVTYVTFDVGVTPTDLLGPPSAKKS